MPVPSLSLRSRLLSGMAGSASVSWKRPTRSRRPEADSYRKCARSRVTLPGASPALVCAEGKEPTRHSFPLVDADVAPRMTAWNPGLTAQSMPARTLREPSSEASSTPLRRSRKSPMYLSDGSSPSAPAATSGPAASTTSTAARNRDDGPFAPLFKACGRKSRGWSSSRGCPFRGRKARRACCRDRARARKDVRSRPAPG
jgi:hypothetical protein